MRHYKADVSHRIKRRPSIFTARWFRGVLGLGVVVIAGLLLGPMVTSWLRGDGRAASLTARPAPAATPAPSPVSTRPSALPAAKPVEPESTASPLATASIQPDPPAPPGPTAKVVEPPKAAADPAPAAAPARPDPSAGGSRGSAVYRIQVGAFLDHRNADRLIERLRGEGVETVNTTVEESRTLYRVLASPREGEGYPALLGRLRELGFTPEPADDGAVVTRPTPLRAAVELSRRLREQGIRVRLDRQASAASFRVVRVGTFDTAEQAERARAELGTRGYEGFVVRESR